MRYNLHAHPVTRDCLYSVEVRLPPFENNISKPRPQLAPSVIYVQES